MEIGEALHVWDEGAWCEAALSIAMTAADGARREAAARVLTAAGLAPSEPQPAGMDLAFAAQAAASVQTAAAAIGDTATWDSLPDEILLAQGMASAQGAAAFSSFVLPTLNGLAERLASPGATMLDVGTGVAALAEAYASLFPQLHVTGVDVSQRVLDLGRSRLRQSAVGSRVELRLQSVAALDDVDAFDLAWVPAPFLPPEALDKGLRRVRAALRPGGWVMMGHARSAGTELQTALTRLKTLAYGGTTLAGEEAAFFLQERGFEAVRALPTPPGAPGITVGRRAVP